MLLPANQQQYPIQIFDLRVLRTSFDCYIVVTQDRETANESLPLSSRSSLQGYAGVYLFAQAVRRLFRQSALSTHEGHPGASSKPTATPNNLPHDEFETVLLNSVEFQHNRFALERAPLLRVYAEV